MILCQLSLWGGVKIIVKFVLKNLVFRFFEDRWILFSWIYEILEGGRK